METKYICRQCGNEFVRKNRAHKCPYHFCSPSCRNKARTLMNMPCLICGATFKPRRINGAGKPAKRYCSQACASIAHRGTASVKKTPAEVRNLVREIYPTQGAEPLMQSLNMTRSAIQNIAYNAGIRLQEDIYRSKVHGAASKYMKSNNPNWQGGITCKEWGKNWIEQRHAARKRDNHTCQICGEQARSVHHIKPRRYFIGHMEDANTLSNLITLCAKHHLLVECGKMVCPKPKAISLHHQR